MRESRRIVRQVGPRWFLDILEADDQFLDDARPDVILVLDPSRMGTRLVG